MCIAMKWFLLITLVLSPAILYGIALLLIAVYQKRCPRCRKHGLRMVGAYLRDNWDNHIEGGMASYYLCHRCGVHLKKSGHTWSDVCDDEWRQHVNTVMNKLVNKRELCT